MDDAAVQDAADALEELATSPGAREDPYPHYERVRAAGPAVRVSDSLLVLIGHPEVDQALRDNRLTVADVEYMDRRWPDWAEHASMRSLSRSLLETNPPDHDRLRRLVSGAFTPRRLAHMREAVAAMAARLIDDMTGAGTVDFMAAFAYPLPVTVICELLGVPEADRPWFRPVGHDLTASLEPMVADLTDADRASEQLIAYFTDLVVAKRAAPGDDLTSALVATHDADPSALSHEELLSNLTLLLVAGFETTTNLFGNGLWTLMRHPAAMAALRAAPREVGAFVEEMLRFDSPVQLASRRVRSPIEVAGHDMPADSETFLMVGGANRDPRRFHRPGEFDPWRADNAPLSFGAGAHFCLGSALARMEAQVGFPMLLERFAGIEPAEPPVRKDRLTLRGYAEMKLSLTGA
jgi:cytochrome P450